MLPKRAPFCGTAITVTEHFISMPKCIGTEKRAALHFSAAPLLFFDTMEIYRVLSQPQKNRATVPGPV